MPVMPEARGACRVICALLSALLAASCGRPENPNDLPYTHWANDSDECVRASVAAIGKAGLGYPNFGTEPVPARTAGEPPAERITTVDMWIGPTRLVIPAKVAAINGFYPQNHPKRFDGLRGTLPNFYPPGDSAPVTDGMAAMVEVRFSCSMEPKYVASWGKGYRSNEEGIEKVKAEYEADAARFDAKRPQPSLIAVTRREDLAMTEVLYHRGMNFYNDGMPMWEASYWPIGKELKGPSGGVSGIKCQTRHDPVERRYGGVGWRCHSYLRLTPHGSAQIDIYVSHLQHMPAVFEQVKQVLVNAQQINRE